MNRIERIWYEGGLAYLALLPFSWLFRCVVTSRRWLYLNGWLKINHFSVPLIVVGNISVGGTGKTPFVVWLARFLRQAGYKPGVVSRGYRGKATQWPQFVTPESDPFLVGDEAVLLARRCRSPMAVAPDRAAAVTALLKNHDCDIIISDDGLQHYAMGRDIEIAMIDGPRRFGNGAMLPAGPLREPIVRLDDVDLVIVNGQASSADEFSMTVVQRYLYNLHESTQRQEASFLAGRTVHGIAGIGHPEKFFELLKQAGAEVIPHPFADHHAYTSDDLEFGDDRLVIMTEKDAVKCADFSAPHHWVMAIEMEPEPQVEESLQMLLKNIGANNDKRV